MPLTDDREQNIPHLDLQALSLLGSGLLSKEGYLGVIGLVPRGCWYGTKKAIREPVEDGDFSGDEVARCGAGAVPCQVDLVEYKVSFSVKINHRW